MQQAVRSDKHTAGRQEVFIYIPRKVSLLWCFFIYLFIFYILEIKPRFISYLFIYGLSLLLTPQLLCWSNFNPQL